MSTYTSFIKLTTISADDMNNNFNHCFAGDWLPLSGATLTTDTTETLDIGSQTDAWNTLYCNNLNIDGEVSQCFNMIAEVTLSAPASDIEFSGLNGDQDEVYIINTRIHANTTTSYILYSYLFNGDSGANYGMQYIIGSDNTTIAVRLSGNPLNGFMGWNGASGYLTVTAIESYSEMMLYAKTGNERVSISNVLEYGGGTYCGDMMNSGCIWNNTSDTITSIKITAVSPSATGDEFGVGTNIQIWAKVSTITSRSITITET